ncbi:hypothetical protein [Arenimonas alkanexedens]
MTQTTHIAAGQTALAGTPVSVTSRATFSLATAAGVRIPGNITIPVYLKQGTEKQVVGSLSDLYRNWVADAPGDFYADRPDISAYGVNVAVLVDA